MGDVTATASRPSLSREQLAAATLVGVTLGYALAVDPVVHSATQLLYPAVWLVTSAAALQWLVAPRLGSVSPPSVAAGVGYALVLLWVAGLLGPATGPPGIDVHLGLPGWGPAVFYTGPVASVGVVPFLTVGYLTLGLLLAVVLERNFRASAAGLLGVFACVGCTAPLLAAFAGAAGAAPIAAALTRAQYPVATAAFLGAVGALAVAVSRTG